VPNHLQKIASAAAKAKQMPAQRIATQQLLHLQRQASKTLSHIGMASRQPNPRATRNRDHRRRFGFANAAISADIVEPSTGPVIRSRAPVANSISITAGATGGDEAGIDPDSGATNTGVKLDAARGSQSCCRHRNNWLA